MFSVQDLSSDRLSLVEEERNSNPEQQYQGQKHNQLTTEMTTKRDLRNMRLIEVPGCVGLDECTRKAAEPE